MTLRRDRKSGQKKGPSSGARLGSGCFKCGHPGAHYVPPSFGDPGFYACDSICKVCRPEGETVDEDV